MSSQRRPATPFIPRDEGDISRIPRVLVNPINLDKRLTFADIHVQVIPQIPHLLRAATKTMMFRLPISMSYDIEPKSASS